MVWGAVIAGGLTAGVNALGQWHQNKRTAEAMENAIGYLTEGAVDRASMNAISRRQPLIDHLNADTSIQNQAVGSRVLANMNLTGLGTTGLGHALAGGASAGASFRNRALIAEQEQLARQEAIALQEQRAVMAMRAAGMTGPSPIAAALQGAAAGAGSYQNYQYGQEMQKYRQQYMDKVLSQPGPAQFQPADFSSVQNLRFGL